MRISRGVRELAWPVIVSLTFVGVMVWVALSMASLSGRLDDARADRDQLEIDLDAQQKTSEALASQVEELGGKPIVDPEDASDPIDADDADDTTSEISQGDIALAVASWCAETRKCKGEDGEKGADGRDVTPVMVEAAVLTYCGADGSCEGPRGKTGDDGTDGAPGEDGDDGTDGSDGDDGSQGSQGPPPSDDQVAEAVAAYCEVNNGCRGPMGEPGPKGDMGPEGPTGPKGDRGEPGPAGQDGDDGRGIQSVTCNADGAWSIQYTDGTSSTTPGPCRVVAPEPTE